MADYLNIAGRVRTTASDGVAIEAQEVKDLNLNKSQQEINADVQTELGDRYTKEETYSQEQLNSLITTPDVNYVSVVATDATTDVTDILPATGEANTIYRVGNWNGTQYDTTMYALFAWNGSAYVCLAVRSFVGEVYDVSVNHPDGQGNPTPYTDLASALGTNGANIPAGIRRGGMSIKFIQGTVQSSDNKYIQARCMAQNFTTDVTQWQGVDDVPTAGSDNLVKSGGLYPIAKKTEEIVIANSDDENERISLQTESDVEFASITPTETNFTGLKSDGKKVLKEENSYEDLGTDEKIVFELSNGEVIAEFDTNGARFKNIGFTNSDYDIVEDINSRVKKQSLKVRIPDVVYAIEGVELNLYNDTVALSCDKGLISPINYKVVWTCTKGKITERGYRFTPQASDVGNVSCKCSVYNIENELLDEKTFTIKVVSKNGISSSKRILFCGDSLGQVTAQDIYADFHSELFGGTIPTMVGSTGTTAKGLYYGGWKWRLFASAGEIMYRCQVSGITSLSIGARYVDEDNGLFTVEEVNLTDGAGNVLMMRLYASGYDFHPLASSGILTKVEGAGDSQFSFTSQEEPGNPLWNASESKLDVAGYRTKIGLASNEKIDMVIFQLGVNDAAGFIYPIVKQQVREDIVSLYEAFIEDNPNCLFVIGNDPVGCNTANGFGSNYGVTNIERFKQHYDELCGIYLDFDEDKTNYPNLRLINENFTIDRYYGYPFSETKISERYPTTENTHSNAWHPASSGYAQLGDSVFAAIVNLLNV